MIKTFGQAAMAEVGASASFAMLSPIVVEHITARSAMLVSGVNETTKQAIRNTLFDGILLGEGTDTLARRISNVVAEASKARAHAIARTEVNTSANFARWQGMAQSGLVSSRRWLSARDSRVRDQHRFLNNKTAGINEPFNVGGFTAMFPGGFGVARLDINCRCTTIPVIAPTDEVSEPAGARSVEAMTKGPFDPDAPIDVLDEYVDGVFRQMAEWEERIAKAVRESFAQQERAAVEELYRLAR
jgi:SPP1 gp7 family putative phage head morphogenesis protein